MARQRTPELREVSERVQAAFGTRLQAARGKRLNQESLAKNLGVTRPSISNIERGQHRVFLDQAYLAAKALGVPLADLLPGLDEVFREGSGIATADSFDGNSNSVLTVEAVVRDVQEVSRKVKRNNVEQPARRR